MLIGNYSVLNKASTRALGGVSHSGTRAAWNKGSPARNSYVDSKAQYSYFSAIPVGYIPPYSWVIPRKSGGKIGRASCRERVCQYV